MTNINNGRVLYLGLTFPVMFLNVYIYIYIYIYAYTGGPPYPRVKRSNSYLG